jgi:excisionase family DNA binding protein
LNTPTPPIGPLLISIQQAGKLLSVGRSKAYEWSNDGTIPTVTIGGMRRVPIRLLEDRIRSLTDGSTPGL